MLDALGAVGLDGTVQLVAGATALGSLATVATAYLAGPPRPCWTGRSCLMKAADPSACSTCSVFLRARDPDLTLRGMPDLGEVRRLDVIGAP